MLPSEKDIPRCNAVAGSAARPESPALGEKSYSRHQQTGIWSHAWTHEWICW